MSEEFTNKPSFAERLKNLKISRPAIVSGSLLLVAVTVITAVAIASNRSKKDVTDVPESTEPQIEQNEDTSSSVNDNEVTDVIEDKVPVIPTDSVVPVVENSLPSFVLPVSGALSKSHDATCQVYSNTMSDYRVHLGLDIVTEASAPVYAAADGTIEKIWTDTLMGYCIAIKHSGDSYTIYKNLSETLPDGIAEGVSVRSGQLIASVGESAMIESAEESHLHFEMTVAGLSVDPLEYFDEKSLQTLSIDASYE